MDDKKRVQNSTKIRSILDKASREESYKKELLKHPKEVLSKAGIDLEKKNIKCHQNTAKDFYIIVPTHPLPEKQKLMALSKDATLDQIVRFVITQVQMNTSLKSKLLTAANDVLKEKGVALAKNAIFHVYANTADTGHLVIPRVPGDNTELSDIEMQAFAGGVSLDRHHIGAKDD